MLAEGQPALDAAPSGQIVAHQGLSEGVRDFSHLASELIGAGFGFNRFAEKETNLESAFMALTKGSGSKI